MFGVGAVIAMLSIGAGAARQAQALIDQLGVRNVLVQTRQLRPDELREARKKSLGVSLRDAEAIREAVPGVELVGPRLRVAGASGCGGRECRTRRKKFQIVATDFLL